MKNIAFLEMLRDFGLLRADLPASAMDAMSKLASESEEKGEDEEEETAEAKAKREKAEKEKAADSEKSEKGEDSVSAADHKIAVAKAAADARVSALAEFQAAADAKTIIKPIAVWEGAQDSADAIYKFALEKAGVAFDGITETAALKALVQTHLKSATVKAPAAPTKSGADTVIAKFTNLKIGL